MRQSNIWIKLALGAIFIFAIGWLLRPYFAGTLVPNPVWLKLSGIELYWYGLLMAIAVLVCIGLVFLLNRRFNHFPTDPLFFTIVYTVVGGFIGARILFVALEWSFYSSNLGEIWRVSHGGMSIHGALIGGALTLWACAKYFKLNVFKIADLIAVVLPIGQAIGRFGNFFNSEAFGGPTNLPWKMYVAPQFRPPEFLSSSFFHPTFLYEAVGNLIIAGTLWWLLRSYRKLPAGSIALGYLILYSSWRFAVEYFRVDSEHLGVLTVAQWGSLGIIVAGLGILFYVIKNGRR
jgi:phosphatidylglycerol---prolipoprotein diacylglyceryl transferase